MSVPYYINICSLYYELQEQLEIPLLFVKKDSLISFMVLL